MQEGSHGDGGTRKQSGARWKHARQGLPAVILHKSLRMCSLLVLPWSQIGEPEHAWGGFGQAPGGPMQWTGCAEEGHWWADTRACCWGERHSGGWERSWNPYHYLPSSFTLLFHFIVEGIFSGVDPAVSWFMNWGVNAVSCAENCHWPKNEKTNSCKMPTATRRDRSQIP